jgi:hypothetical protein
VWGDLEYEIARTGEECGDNFRAYRAKDLFLFEQFIAAAKSGCCGVLETSTIVDGEKWVIGCNYGH